MTLAFYFFRQVVPPLLFGTVLFIFVLLLDKLFDIVDLIFNKGVQFGIVVKLFSLFIPTILPLTVPMAFLLACLMTFGRLSEENELTAVRSAGITLPRVLWLPPLFAFLVSCALVPFNSRIAPWCNQAFRKIYEQIASSDPLINIEPKKFFAIKNLKIYADTVDKENNRLTNLFVYQLSKDGKPSERVFARSGEIESYSDSLILNLHSGQIQQYGDKDAANLTHTKFSEYRITVPLLNPEKTSSTRFRNINSPELKKIIAELKGQKNPASALEAEYHLRYAIAFAPFALVLMGMPLATVLKKGGKGFGFGVSLVLIFAYYTLLIFGLTMAEKGTWPPILSLWLANSACLLGSFFLIRRLLKQ